MYTAVAYINVFTHCTREQRRRTLAQECKLVIIFMLPVWKRNWLDQMQKRRLNPYKLYVFVPMKEAIKTLSREKETLSERAICDP